jgi:hypothetical protein
VKREAKKKKSTQGPKSALPAYQHFCRYNRYALFCVFSLCFRLGVYIYAFYFFVYLCRLAIYFLISHFQHDRATLLAESPNLSFGDIARQNSERWKNLSREDRMPFEKVREMKKSIILFTLIIAYLYII